MAAKKKSNKSQDLPWRPNFNQKDRLPDTKAVRTDFIINSTGIFITVVVLGFLAFREYSVSGMRSSIADIELRIQENSSANRNIIAAFTKFNVEKNTLKEAVEFNEHPVQYSQILRLISEKLPPGMMIQSVIMKPEIQKEGRRENLVYQISIKGTLMDEPGVFPSEVIADFQQSLSNMDLIKDKVIANNLAEFARNNQLKIYNFSIELSLKGETEK